MKSVKVILSAVIVLAVLIFFVAPPVMGLWVKYQCRNTLAQITKGNPRISAKMSRYHFGWFRSQATLEFDWHLHPHMPYSANNTIHIIGNLDINHGPIIFTEHNHKKHFYIALASMKANVPMLNLTYRAIWHLNNTIVTDFSSPSFAIKSAPITLENLQGKANYQLRRHQLKLYVSVGSFNFLNAIRFNRLVYKTDVDQEGFINYGKQELTADTIAINTTANPIQLNKMFINSDTARNNGKITLAVNYGVQSILKNQLGVNGIRMDFAIKKIDEKTLNALLKVLEEQQNQTPDKKAHQTLATASINFLRQGVTVQIHYLHLKTDQGNVLLKGSLAIPTLDKDATLLQLPIALRIDLHLQTPKNWLQERLMSFGFFPHPQDLKDIANRLQYWEDQGLLTSSGNDYKMRIQLQNGYLLINGKTPTMGPQNRVDSNHAQRTING